MSLLTASDFCRAVISQLVLEGVQVIEPKNAADRYGFSGIVRAIGQVTESVRATEGTSSPWYRTLVRLRNYLQPSNNGSFEHLETVLRDLQTSTLQTPNPDYDYMRFELSAPHAREIVERLGDQQRALARAAARAFLEQQATRRTQP